MINQSDWKAMKKHAFDAYSIDGKMNAAELGQIVDIGCADGNFDEQEKAVLINVITSLTRADMDDAMWLKVEELIHKFELHDDNDAVIEDLEHDEVF